MGNNCCDGEKLPQGKLPVKGEMEVLASAAKAVEVALPSLHVDLQQIKSSLTSLELTAASTQSQLVNTSKSSKALLQDAWDLLESAQAAVVRCSVHANLSRTLPALLPHKDALRSRLFSCETTSDTPEYLRLATEGNDQTAQNNISRLQRRITTLQIHLNANFHRISEIQNSLIENTSALETDIFPSISKTCTELRTIYERKGDELRAGVLLDEEIAVFAQVSRPSFLYEQLVLLGKMGLELSNKAKGLKMMMEVEICETSLKVEELKEAENQVEICLQGLIASSFPIKPTPNRSISQSPVSTNVSPYPYHRSMETLHQSISEETQHMRVISDNIEELKETLAQSCEAVRSGKARVVVSWMQLRELRLCMRSMYRWRLLTAKHRPRLESDMDEDCLPTHVSQSDFSLKAHSDLATSRSP